SPIPLASLQALLGYLNFSEGKPDPRFQKQLSEAYAQLTSRGSAEPWRDLAAALRSGLESLKQSGASAFREVEQAQAVLDLSLDQTLQAYRAHDGLLLAHQRDADW